MSREMPTKPKVAKRLWQPAFVVFWNDELVHVLCPHCEKIEHHYYCSTTQSPSSKDNSSDFDAGRVFNCRSQRILPYEIWFPFESHVSNMGLGWERDTNLKGYKTVGLDLPNRADESLLTVGENGNAQTLRALPSKPVELEDACGNSKLSLEARNGNLVGLRDLFLKGANINAANHCGWTPLMHAAFWGRTDCVVFLLEHGASQNNFDKEGRTAFELAGDDKFFSREQRRMVHRFAEDFEKMDKERRIIRKLLGPAQIPSTFGQQQYAAFRTTREVGKPAGCITLSGRVEVAEIRVPSRKGTLGVLSRGGPFPYLVAVSGWNNRSHGSPLLINNDFHTNQVLKLCKFIGHKLPLKVLEDNGEPGKFYASHVEKQLVTAFLIKHRFVTSKTPCNIRPPPQNLQSAVLFINRHPCKDCRAFCETAGKTFGVEFKLVDIERIEDAEKPTERVSGTTVDSAGKPFRRNSRKSVRQPRILTPKATNSPSSALRRTTRSSPSGLHTPGGSVTDEYLNWGYAPAVSGKRRKTVMLEPEEIDESDSRSDSDSISPRRRAGKGLATGLLTPEESGVNEQLPRYRSTVPGKRRKRATPESEDEMELRESPSFGRNVAARLTQSLIEIIDLTECSDG